MKITAQLLRDANACEEQVAIFATQWPDGDEVTLANCRKAAKLGLDFDWAARHLLSAPAWVAYKEATAPALAACEKARAPLKADHSAR